MMIKRLLSVMVSMAVMTGVALADGKALVAMKGAELTESALMKTPVRKILVGNPALSAEAAALIGAKKFSGTPDETKMLLSVLRAGGQTKRVSEFKKELEGRLATLPEGRSAQKRWVEQQIAMKPGEYIAMNTERLSAKSETRVSLALPETARVETKSINALAEMEAISQKSKLLESSPKLVETAIEAAPRAKEIGLLRDGFSKCLGNPADFTDPKAIKAVLLYVSAAKTGKALELVQKEGAQLIQKKLYKNEKLCSVVNNRLRPALDNGGSCQIINVGNFCN